MTNHQNEYENITTTAAASREGTPAPASSSREDHDYYYISHEAGRVHRRSWTAEETDRIVEAYQGNISENITAAVAHMLEDAYDHGLSVDDIVAAIEETGFAPRPSPAYLRKILETWVTTGVTVSKIRHISRVNKGLPWWKKDNPNPLY